MKILAYTRLNKKLGTSRRDDKNEYLTIDVIWSNLFLFID